MYSYGDEDLEESDKATRSIPSGNTGTAAAAAGSSPSVTPQHDVNVDGGEQQAASSAADDADFEELKKKVKEMEEEAHRLEEISKVEASPATNATKEEVDARSVYVGNVDYSTSAEELQTHFQSCGTVNRITILYDKFTNQPKGFAYVEFADKDSVAPALALNESEFKGRQLKAWVRPDVGVLDMAWIPAPMAMRAPRSRSRSRANFFHPYM